MISRVHQRVDVVVVDHVRTLPQNVRMTRRLGTVKKTYNLPPDLVKRVKKLLRAKTETEAIVRCMSEVAFMDDVERAAKKTGGRFPTFEPLE